MFAIFRGGNILKQGKLHMEYNNLSRNSISDFLLIFIGMARFLFQGGALSEAHYDVPEALL